MIEWLRGVVAGKTTPPPGAVPLREAQGRSVDPDEPGWRRLSGGLDRRDLPAGLPARMRRLAYQLWRYNPIANRMIELPLAYIVADGVRLVSDDAEAHGWLEVFWRDPANRMSQGVTQIGRELALFGECFRVVFCNPYSGVVRLGSLDPEMVEAVVWDPDNAACAIGVVTRPDMGGRVLRYRVAVGGAADEEMLGEAAQKIRKTFTDGEIFYFAVNALANGGGHSDLLPMIDWLDSYDQFLFGEVERFLFTRAFVWDVTLTGATPEEIVERARSITPPRPGGVRVHNEGEQWAAVAPALQGAESTEIGRLFRNHILGGGTLPEHWYGGGGDVNRSTSDSMSEPTFKMFSARQALLGEYLEEIGRYVVRARLASLGRQISPLTPMPTVQAEFPEMVARDTARFAGALQQTVAAAVGGVDAGLLTRATGARLVQAVASRLGVVYDPVEEALAAGSTASRVAEEAAFRAPPGGSR